MAAFLQALKTDTERDGHKSSANFHGHPIVTVRPAAFKRCLANLVSNAARHAPSISITGHRDHRWLTVTVDDDGPGIVPHLREEVFKPFLRIDDARNQDEGGTGLGLAIARDIARSHGGDIVLSDSPLGGLRATVRVRCNTFEVVRAHDRFSLVPNPLYAATVSSSASFASLRWRRRTRPTHFGIRQRSSKKAGQALSARERAVQRGHRAGMPGNPSSFAQTRNTDANRSASPAPAPSLAVRPY